MSSDERLPPRHLGLPGSPQRSWRVIGAVVVAQGRSLDLALLETDQTTFARRIESGRSPLDAGDGTRASLVETIGSTLLSFMGDRALQPFAVDVIGIAAEDAFDMRAVLAERLDVHIVPVDRRQAEALATTRKISTFALAERVAMLALRDVAH